MRKEYEMTQNQLNTLLDACKPVPAMYLPGGQLMGLSPQENANRAWAALGKEMGFNPFSVRPVAGKGDRFFTAEESR